MAGGPLLPSSIYLGGASGNLSASVFIPGTNTNAAGAIEAVGVVASLGANADCILQFNLPEIIPTGILKLRTLAWATATGTAKITVADAQTAPNSNIGATTLTSEPQITMSLSLDVINENKLALSTSPASNSILTAKATFNNTGWTLAVTGYFQFSLVWE